MLNSDKKAFVPFIMAGHPSMVETTQAIMMMAEAGVDLIELGVPFSDPVADGPINQLAAEIALSQGVNLKGILDQVKATRLQGCKTPIILFSYYNPILAFGIDAFVRDAKEAGVKGVLVVDLPPEEGALFYNQLKKAGLEVVLLVSPTTNPHRFALYRQISPAFIYYISRLSVTGVQESLAPQLAEELRALRTHFPTEKILIGFGISTTEQAQVAAQLADGVVVGSVLVNTLHTKGLKAFEELIRQFVRAVSE